MKTKLKVGDTVRVKKGTKDPDYGFDIGNWHGRIAEIDSQNSLGLIELDSITLSEIPDEYFKKCEVDGVAWDKLYLDLGDIEKAEKRGTEKALAGKREEIEHRHRWDYFGESGEIINQALDGFDDDYDSEADQKWENYLEKKLSFPIDAVIGQYQNRGPLQQNDKIRIHGIYGTDDSYGVIAKIRFGRKAYHFPLCDIDVMNKSSDNHKIIEAYSVWFSNR